MEEPVLGASTVKKGAKREPLGEEASWGSGSEEEEEEEGGTAFDVETDSDMNSQESRSDLEDMEEGENSENLEGQARDNQEEEEDEDQPKDGGGERDGETPPATNGPLAPSDSSISSNLQAMSSQLFQAKRCFRLAPTFSNMLLRPRASSSSGVPTPTDTSAPPSQETPPPPGDLQRDLTPATANGTNENGTLRLSGTWVFIHLFVFLEQIYLYLICFCLFSSLDLDSDSEGSQHSTPSVHSEKTFLEKLEILTNQGLMQVVKVFIDWLRTNTDIILMCAQVRSQVSLQIYTKLWFYRRFFQLIFIYFLQSSQSLWNRLSVLLNLLPDGNKLLEAGELKVLQICLKRQQLGFLESYRFVYLNPGCEFH